MPRKDQDSLDQDFTRMGETDDIQPQGKKSLSNQSTFGDAGSSASGLDHALAHYIRGLAYGEKGDESKSKADFPKAKEVGYEVAKISRSSLLRKA